MCIGKEWIFIQRVGYGELLPVPSCSVGIPEKTMKLILEYKYEERLLSVLEVQSKGRVCFCECRFRDKFTVP